MAHLADGVLSAPVLIAGTAGAVAAIAVGLRRIDGDRVPRIGLMSAAFFVASLVHVPIGPSSAHLLLSGLTGVLLGWTAVPAIFVALVLQATFFGFGGLTVLGVNTLILGLPAVLSYHLFGVAVRRPRGYLWGGAAGAFGVLGTCAAVGVALALSGREFLPAAKLVVLSHLPVLVVEALVTASIVAFLQKVKPEMLLPAAARAA
jgi:cobalt/nickel transport system permease protein